MRWVWGGVVSGAWRASNATGERGRRRAQRWAFATAVDSRAEIWSVDGWNNSEEAGTQVGCFDEPASSGRPLWAPYVQVCGACSLTSDGGSSHPKAGRSNSSRPAGPAQVIAQVYFVRCSNPGSTVTNNLFEKRGREVAPVRFTRSGPLLPVSCSGAATPVMHERRVAGTSTRRRTSLGLSVKPLRVGAYRSARLS